MPDWLTHLVFGLILSELLCINKKSIFLLGSLLPDFIVKINLLFLFIKPYYNIQVFHTPVMGVLTAFLITPLFRYDKKKIFLLLSSGAIVHLLFDLFVKNFGDPGVMLFFPLSFNNYNLSLIWADQFFYIVLPGLLIIYFSILVIKKITGNKASPEIY